MENNTNSLSYKPNLNYCNTDGLVDTFDYTLNGGSTTSVFVTVSCIDDMPVAVTNISDVDEDASFTVMLEWSCCSLSDFR